MASTIVPYLFLLAFLVLPLSTIAKSYKNISLGSTLTTSDVTNFWPSPSGEFAFGFQKIGNSSSGFLLAIWFNKLKEKTIVWSANRDKFAPDGSKIQLSMDGRLVLTDPNGQEIWARGELGAGPAYGAMLDTGNFVLATTSISSATQWQSFDEPTDTILPGQVLNRRTRLVSSLSDTNVSSGRFELLLQDDGNLVFYKVEVNDAYWSSTTGGSGYQVIFNQSGFIFVQAKNGTLLNLISSSNEANSTTSQLYHQRAILEYDGVFRHYVYPKKSSSGRPMEWFTLYNIPDNICLSQLQQGIGGIACGFNSLCSIGTDRRPRCECPLGYILNDPNDKIGNCKPNFPEQDCKDESRDVEAFTIHEMLNTSWFGGDYASYINGTEDSCRQNCLSDCYCALAVYYPGACWKKRYPLLNGRVDSAELGKALLKIGKDNSTVGLTTTTTTTPPQSQDGEKRKNQSSLIISVSVLLGSSVFVLMLLAFLYVFKFKGKKPKKISPYQVASGMNIRSFSYNELEEATNGFEEVLGTGAFSTVYKAVLNDENGKIVAVKKLHKTVTEGEEGFQAEVNSISRTNHKNLIQLLGFCNEGQHRLLVYEHMKNGSLADLLFKDSRLSWSKRVQVAIDTAKGLCYLHEECRDQIIHCDIKPHNVLLDESLTANIADFGIAKLLGKDQTRTTTKVRGTRGYIAPEWFRNTAITVKVDVYSFGILLLELICCRKSYKQDVANENEMILAEWACDCYRRNELHLLAGDDEEAIEDTMRFEKLLMVAIWCIQENPALRPSMKNVILMLEGSKEVSIPPDPFSFICSG
ncbi:G-type lectin S-receptor-like serine/threonine-protein kinase LECRK2 [Lycium ferocissimum]|uniref:G-type lectin S-receptor-like serine/threonine-protein kinase LECRK2 n=1 Tax=Lycium ferocissimum TaxID=112874 RepID=UPI0028151F7D|nr:G-type lectin S-receptor-like serine/threonine-protein kinase LECRK2 [Lycium ferocissimum]